MYVYHFYNRLFVGERRTIVFSFPPDNAVLLIMKGLGWEHHDSPPAWWRS